VTVALLAYGGCVFSIGGSRGNCPPSAENTNCTLSSTIVEIDAAGELSSEESRLELYKALAQRPNLTSAERAHLVEAVGDNLNNEESRAEVLLLLAQN
jgi:hypothetical protein